MAAWWKKVHKKQKGLRKLVLGVLKRVNPGDIRIRHPYVTGAKFKLHSYKHKGYWYHGKRREESEMRFFGQAVQAGDTVIEVGGHIGYIAMYFADLAGPKGKVYVFEPGLNNLPYIKENAAGLENLELVEKAVSNEIGTARFFEEALTGQNNSLLSDYSVFEKNVGDAFSNEGYQAREVPTVTLDSFAAENGVKPDFMKIDVEGAEWLALQGAREVLADSKPALMVEVTNHLEEVTEFLQGLGYLMFSESGRPIREAKEIKCDICALHPSEHQELANQLGWDLSLS